MDKILLQLSSFFRLNSKPLTIVGIALILPVLYPQYEKYIKQLIEFPSNGKKTIKPNQGRAPSSTSLLNKEFPTPVIEPVSPDFDYKTTKPYPYRPFKNGEYKMTMATRRSDASDAFVIEDTYLDRTNLRAEVLDKAGDVVSGFHESGIPAVRELYDFVFDYFLKKYPMYFQLVDDGKYFYNKIRDEKHPMDNSGLTPREVINVLGRTIEEDFLIMLKNADLEGDDCDEYVLRVACACFPAGFNPADKLNKPLTAIHGPVPQYEKRLKTSMNRFWTRLKANEFVVRTNWAMQAHANLCAPEGSHATPEEAEDIEPVDAETLDFNKVFLRCEKQTLTRLPKSHATMIITRTYTTPLTEIRAEGRGVDLAGAIDGLPDDVAVYKNRTYWGPAAKKYLLGETNGCTDDIYKHKFVLNLDML
ncbi:hypothetical protein CANARDRAFT_27440 [[Candida] arabinofermentans NRRL YB-2248]|uniref:Uncharacterized protein n=1 Tax=[Candida] arabinofermentans NRRL YB-2248 TaxID=983967 RepID=A0A1E4T346_9ASCO|nr:hypothetical protein CANARDRAFT_27440 [[Candida] arabinofermentans NRRL YB-2248]